VPGFCHDEASTRWVKKEVVDVDVAVGVGHWPRKRGSRRPGSGARAHRDRNEPPSPPSDRHAGDGCHHHGHDHVYDHHHPSSPCRESMARLGKWPPARRPAASLRLPRD